MRIALNGSDWRMKGFYGEDWVWRNSEKPDTRDLRYWYPATVPGTVQHDLWKAGLTPDPYWEQNSLALEWIPARTWIYKKRFHVADELKGRRMELHFEGVDFEAQFSLNGVRLGAHRSMFVPVVFDVTDHLKYGEENELAVILEPAPEEQPQVSKTSRVTTHKSRMTYWWDFCPRMPHLGIWDAVYLEATGPTRVEDVFVRANGSGAVEVAATLSVWERDGAAGAQQVQQDAEIAAAGAGAGPAPKVGRSAEVGVVVRDRAGEVVAQAAVRQLLVPGQNRFTLSLAIPEPELWWPNGEGGQPLYTCEVSVDGSHSKSVTFGIRSVELVRNETEDATARPYTFVVNGRKVYLRGWNWVPIDVMYGVERPEKLERLLQLLKRAGVNLVRIWGGGLIEREAFYDLCDRYGIMVWQEFIMSSSGIANKPSTDPAFIQMMVTEAEGIIPRKRNHPSLVLWCGGNELSDLKGRPLDDDEPVLADLHGVMHRLDPDRHWLPTSPTGRAFGNTLKGIAEDPLGMHDVHGPWEHQGLTGQYTLYNKGCSLLHSEFGAEGMTNRRTLDTFVSKQNQWPASRDNPVWFHRGAWWTNEPVVQECFGGGISEIDTLQRASQFLQHEALRYALESDRRRAWQCSGTIPWQFNEPYPNGYCTSAVDYYALPKPGYWAVAGAYEAVRPCASFATQAWTGERFEADLWVLNAAHSPIPGATLNARVVGASGQVYAEQSHTVDVAANGTTAAGSITVPLSHIHEEIFFLDLAVGDATNRYLFTKTATLAPMLTLPSTALRVERVDGGVAITNTGASAALNVRLEDARPVGAPGWVYLSADYFTLLPGDTRTVAVEWTGVTEGPLAIQGWNTEVVTIA